MTAGAPPQTAKKNDYQLTAERKAATEQTLNSIAQNRRRCPIRATSTTRADGVLGKWENQKSPKFRRRQAGKINEPISVGGKNFQTRE